MKTKKCALDEFSQKAGEIKKEQGEGMVRRQKSIGCAATAGRGGGRSGPTFARDVFIPEPSLQPKNKSLIYYHSVAQLEYKRSSHC